MKRVITVLILAFVGLIIIVSLGGMLDLNVNRGVTGWFETNSGVKTGAVEFSATTTEVAETFTLESNQSVSKAKLLLYRSAAAPEDLNVELYAVDVNHKPTGSILVAGTIDCSAITEEVTGEELTVTFGTPYVGSVDTEYALRISRTSVTAGSIFVIYSADENRGLYFLSSDTGSSWTIDDDKDVVFTLYGTATSSALYQGLLRMSIWVVPVFALLAICYAIFKLLGARR